MSGLLHRLLISAILVAWSAPAEARPPRPDSSDRASRAKSKKAKAKAKRGRRDRVFAARDKETGDRAADEPDATDGDPREAGRPRSADAVAPSIAVHDEPLASVEPRGTIAEAPPQRTPPRRPAFYFRAGLLHQESNPGETTMALPIRLPADQMANSGVEMIETQNPLAMIIGYALPVLGRRIALETVLGFPVKTQFRATGTLATQSLAPDIGGVPTGIEPLGPDLGEATFATPLLTAVYHQRIAGPVALVVGLGGMLLTAYDEKITNRVLNEAGTPTLSISPAAGLVLQGGVELRLWRRVSARLDAKYVAGMTVEARVEHIAVLPKALPVGAIEIGTAVLTAEVAPFVVQAGIGIDL